MAYDIHLTQEAANVIGLGNVVTVSALTVSNGLLSVGLYHVPLNNILLIKEV